MPDFAVKQLEGATNCLLCRGRAEWKHFWAERTEKLGNSNTLGATCLENA